MREAIETRLGARNYFDDRDVAERYGEHRPDVHSFIAGRIEPILFGEGGSGRRVPLALDVGCGTGQSTVALTALSDRVVGVDASRHMLRVASPDPRVTYVRSLGEELPFRDEAFELVNVALAFHWLDRDRFLAEAARVLQPGGRLVVYNSWFAGTEIEDSRFEAFFRDEYLRRFPAPPRRRAGVDLEGVAAFGFELAGRDSSFETNRTLRRSELADYLMTQTNVIAAVERGESLAEIKKWLRESLKPFFLGARKTFPFGGSIWCLRKSPPE